MYIYIAGLIARKKKKKIKPTKILAARGGTEVYYTDKYWPRIILTRRVVNITVYSAHGLQMKKKNNKVKQIELNVYA